MISSKIKSFLKYRNNLKNHLLNDQRSCRWHRLSDKQRYKNWIYFNISDSFPSLIMSYNSYIRHYQFGHFCIMLVVMVSFTSSTDSLQYSLKSNLESNKRYFEPLNKNYCKITTSRHDGRASNLISSIIIEMQENADGTLSCVSIFANEDDFFAQGTMILNKSFVIIY